MKLNQNVTLSLIEELHYLINSFNNIVSSSDGILVKQFIVTDDMFSLEGDIYTYKLTHNFSTDMLLLNAVDLITNEAVPIGYKVVDKDNILLQTIDNERSYKINITVNVLKGGTE